ncbi:MULTISPECIES: hypothetical protein [Pseudomonas]|jgi:hypothetical protein|uniref:Uncharacterized protein n=1 Tax=Pseudomonas promysalinigenes TaxID=485898 RepID=A0ABY6AJG6_9PSED|nr:MULTISPECIES: hypothetical protein [Pseudomonas]QXI33325.1 hypothetical protein HU725_020320 [Pseudomonas promysalinigenes]UXH39512.1 hypothetical protein N5C08_21570 [Pseudomonas promysalinigenes]
MERSAFKDFLEAQINGAAKQIFDKQKADLDHIAFGKLSFLLSLRRVVDGTATREDLGMHDAVNDVLQTLGLIDSKSTYLKMIPK